MQQIIQQTVGGLGYELVAVERLGSGTLRVIIDFPWEGQQVVLEQAWQPEKLITTQDCEKVSNQLQYVFEVESIDYKRLEVSSPGLDRELLSERDLWRYQHYMVDLTLKQPIAQQGNGLVAGNRKKFRGTLLRVENGWQLLWKQLDEQINSKAQKKKPFKQIKQAVIEQTVNVMNFTYDEVREVKLVPMVNFPKK